MTITALIVSTAAGPVSNAVGRMYAHALDRRRLGALWGATGRFFGEMHFWVIVLGAGTLLWVAHSTQRVWMPIGILVLANSLLGWRECRARLRAERCPRANSCGVAPGLRPMVAKHPRHSSGSSVGSIHRQHPVRLSGSYGIGTRISNHIVEIHVVAPDRVPREL